MKIETNQIKITGQLSSLDVLKNLKPGSRVPVTITERLGQRYAVLDIGGSKVKAQFLQGVPNFSKLFLVLESKAGGILLFKIADNSQHKDELMERLSESTVFNRGNFGKSIYNLRSQLRESIGSIFALNKSLLKFTGYTDKDNKNERLKNIFNKLLTKGADYKNLLLIAELLANQNNSITQLVNYIFPQISLDHQQISDKDKLKHIIKYFGDLIDESFTEDEKADAIRDILGTMTDASEKGETQFGEVLFFDDNKFKLCRYILYNNNIVMSLNLSYLGYIDILIRQDKSFRSVAFYCENEESTSALKGEIAALPLYYEKDIRIIFCNNTESIKKIIEIISDIDLEYQLDVKA
ncbi:MAG: hypothetical protein V1874_15455 [Spirochaetota bacterium]